MYRQKVVRTKVPRIKVPRDVVIKPPAPSAAPVVISVVESNLSTTGVTITFTANEPCQGQIEYGTTASYGSTTNLESSFNYTTHIQNISGLSSATLYHYRVKFTNQAGLTTYSDDGTFTTEGTALLYPPTRLTNPAPSPTPPMTRPSYLVPSIDPTWGTSITRVTNIAGVRHGYASRPAWNMDMSYLMLDWANPNRQLLRGDDYTMVDGNNSNGTNFCWSRVLPNRAWCSSGLTIRRLLVTDAQGTQLEQSFDCVSPSGVAYSALSFGAGGGNVSFDDRRLAIIYKKTNNMHGVAVFDTVVGGITVERDIASSTGPLSGNVGDGTVLDSAFISDSGRYLIQINENRGTVGSITHGTWVYDANNLSTATRWQATTHNSHSDVGSLNGQDIFVQASLTSSGTPRQIGGTIVMTNLDTKAYTNIQTPYANSHISLRNYNFEGWVFLSQFRNNVYPYDQVVAYSLEDIGQVKVYAHARHNGLDNYGGETMAVPSPDGRKVIFASYWGGTTELYSYVAEQLS